MNNPINNKYIELCAQFGIDLDIHTVTALDSHRYKATEENGIWCLDICDNIPKHLKYEKVLVWGIRDVLLPRLVLETKNLLIRRFSEQDRENCLPLFSDSEDCYMDCCRCFSSKDDAYYERVELFIQRETQYAVTLKSSGDLIGIINVFPDEARAVDAMEIGYCVIREHQRKGYATEMLSAMLNLLQGELLVDVVSAGTLPENVASIALLKKIGFKAEGIRHHGTWHEGLDKPVDIQYFYHDRICCTSV